MITIRQAGPEDAGALHTVAAATFALACPPGTAQADIDDFVAEHLSVARIVEYLADPARELFLALDSDAPDPIGYTMLIYGEPADPEVAVAITARPTVELSKCYVLPGHHGAGVASGLVGASVEAAEQRGAAAVWLGVNQFNPRANRFYEKSGFRIVGNKHFTVGREQHDDFVRERVL